MTNVTFEVIGNGRMYVLVNNDLRGISDRGFPITTALRTGDSLKMAMQPDINSDFIKLCDVPQTECRSISVSGSKLVYDYKILNESGLPTKMVATFSAPTPTPTPSPTPSPSPIPGPAPTGQKEYVFEFSGSLSGLSSTAVGAINKIVQLLGGKSAYIEGNKIVVVM